MKPSLWPSLGYKDAAAAVSFLVEAFGFDEVARHPGTEPGLINKKSPALGGRQHHHRSQRRTRHCWLRRLWPTLSNRDLPIHGRSGRTVRPRRCRRRAQPAGGPTTLRTRDATVIDPEGFAWSFGTYRATNALKPATRTARGPQSPPARMPFRFRDPSTQRVADEHYSTVDLFEAEMARQPAPCRTWLCRADLNIHRRQTHPNPARLRMAPSHL